MEILEICILNNLLTNFGENEFSYKELRLYLSKVHRIQKNFTGDVISKFISRKYIIKLKPNSYKLNIDLQDLIINNLEKIHLAKNKILTKK